MRRIVNYEITAQTTTHDSKRDQSLTQLFIDHDGDKQAIIDSQLAAMWLKDEDIPHPDNYKKTWRYFVVDKFGADVFEYRELDQAVKTAKLLGDSHRIRIYEPTIDQLSRTDRNYRTEKRYSSGFGG